MQQQRAQLMTQREEYVKKASVLRRELELLRDQKQDLLSDGSRDRDLDLILKENDKLQVNFYPIAVFVNVRLSDLSHDLSPTPLKNRNIVMQW